jgi:hypothetical protein
LSVMYINTKQCQRRTQPTTRMIMHMAHTTEATKSKG